jgi:crossover junction endodeoxyribonuclease RuvC
LLVAAQSGLEVHEYPPAVVKRTVVGRGAADKTQVARLVAALLGLKTPPEEDAADALAVAITHIQASRSKGIRR